MKAYNICFRTIVVATTILVSGCAELFNRTLVCGAAPRLVAFSASPITNNVEQCVRHVSGNPVQACCRYSATVPASSLGTTGFDTCKVVSGGKVTLQTISWVDHDNGTSGTGAIGGLVEVDRLSTPNPNGVPEVIEKTIYSAPPPGGFSAQGSTGTGVDLNAAWGTTGTIAGLNCSPQGCPVGDYSVVIFPNDFPPAGPNEVLPPQCPTDVELKLNLIAF
ncbi:MAG: hypothetical protein AAF542_23220 [Pseudomonadota bacterium]